MGFNSGFKGLMPIFFFFHAVQSNGRVDTMWPLGKRWQSKERCLSVLANRNDVNITSDDEAILVSPSKFPLIKLNLVGLAFI